MEIVTGSAHPPRRYIHHETGLFRITSDTPVHQVPFVPIADVLLPGALGTYVYPQDAVLQVFDGNEAHFLKTSRLAARRRTKHGGEGKLTCSVVLHEPDDNEATNDIMKGAVDAANGASDDYSEEDEYDTSCEEGEPLEDPEPVEEYDRDRASDTEG